VAEIDIVIDGQPSGKVVITYENGKFKDAKYPFKGQYSALQWEIMQEIYQNIKAMGDVIAQRKQPRMTTDLINSIAETAVEAATDQIENGIKEAITPGFLPVEGWAFSRIESADVEVWFQDDKGITETVTLNLDSEVDAIISQSNVPREMTDKAIEFYERLLFPNKQKEPESKDDPEQTDNSPELFDSEWTDTDEKDCTVDDLRDMLNN
jgi:hypothetical protein